MIANYNVWGRARTCLKNERFAQGMPPSGPLGLRGWCLAVLFLAISTGLSAQVSVSATAGTAGPTNYATLNAAFAAVNAGTHQGAITMLVTANTSEPATAVPLLRSNSPSSYTSIVIRPSGGNFTIASAAAPTASRGMIELNGADNVTIDGDDPATAGVRNLTFSVAQVTTTGVAAIRFASSSTTDGATFNTVKNCVIQGSRSSETSTVANYGIYSGTSGTSNTSTSGQSDNNDNLTFENNVITRCSYGIYVAGTSTNYTDNLIIRNNTIGSASATADRVAIRGILVQNSQAVTTPTSSAAIIEGNDLQTGTTSGGGSYSAIDISNGNSGALVRNNYIHDCINPTSSVWGMYGIHISGSTNNSAIHVYNNIIRDISGYLSASSAGNQYAGAGIYVSVAATGIKINHNTIVQNINSPVQCIFVNSATATIAQMMNNIIINRSTSALSHGVYLNAAANISGGTVNNNNYFANGGHVGYYTANRTNLSAWQSATSKDANSISENTSFASATDLHIPAGTLSLNESAGASVATTGVSVDYDNQSRPGPAGSVNGFGTAPDIGADEFDGIAPSCFTPSALNVTAITSTTANISWTAPTTAPSAGYQYEVRTSGAAGSGNTGLFTGGSTAAGVTTLALSGLTPETSYSVYVRSNCGTDFSAWTSALTIYTGYCVPSGVVSSYWITNFSMTNAVSNINSTTAGAAGGYSNMSATVSGQAYAGQQVNFSITANTSTHYFYVWVDWNNDFDFADAGETLVATTSYAASYGGNYTIPAGTVQGSYRMRVANSWSGVIGPCGPASSGGEYEDYTLTIVQTPTCFAPTALTAAGVTSTTANISWTAATPAPAQGYLYEVRTSGAAGSGATGLVQSGSTVAGDVTETLTSLAPNTTFTVYVRGNCGAGDLSAWSSGVTFTTLCAGANLATPLTMNFDGGTTLPTCWSKTSGWVIASTSTDIGANPVSAPNFMYRSYSTSTTEYFYSAPVDMTTAPNGATLRMRLWRHTSGLVGDTYTIMLNTTPSVTGATTLSTISSDADAAPASTTGWYAYEAAIPSSFNTATSLYVIVRGIGGGTFSSYDLGIDNFMVLRTPTCYEVTGLTVSNLSPMGADLSWTAPTQGVGPVGYEYAVTTSITPPASGTQVTGTAVSASGLVAGTTYYAHVRSVCVVGSDYSQWTTSAPFKFIYGDACAYAIDLGTLTSPVSGDTAAFTQGFVPTCNSSSNTAPEVFYSINVPVNYTLNIGQTANNYDSVHVMFYGNCTTNTLITCLDGSETTAINWVNNTGSAQTVYWVQDGWAANSGTYTLAWTLTPPPIVVTSFDPTSVCSGNLATSVVTLTGSNFTNATSVTLNGVSTPFTVVNDTTINVNLTAGSTAGNFVVYNAVTSGTSATALEVVQSPAITPIINGDTSICVFGSVDLDNESFGGTWSSSNEAVATVDADGIVSGLATGVVTITYTVEQFGCTSSATTTINVNEAPFTNAPSSQIVVTGDPAQFTVAPTGVVDAYQWMVSTDGGDSFNPIEDDALYGGSTTNTLSIASATEDMNGYLYMVYLTAVAPCEDYMSPPALLTVGNVGIVTHPEDVNLCGSGTAQFSVSATGPNLTYQWQENSGGGFTDITDGTVDGITYAGTDTVELTVSGLSIDQTGRSYRVRVMGPNTVNSNAASVNIFAAPTVSAPEAQQICYSGGSTTFTVTPSAETTSVQWQYSTDGTNFANVVNGTPVGATYANANTNALTVTTTSATPVAGTYYFRAVVEGSEVCGEVNSAAAQLIINNAAITQQPVAASVNAGSSATFTVTAATTNSATYQWQYATAANGTFANVIDATPAGVTYSGADTATLTVNASEAALASTARYYRVIVSSGTGCSVTSTPAQLTIVNYCVPVATNTATYISNFTTTGGLTNIANASGTTISPSGYGNFTNLSASAYQGATVNFTTANTGGLGLSIWIDFNNNKVFETSERVFNTTAYGSNQSGSFTIPMSATTGPKRMRVLADYNSTSPTNSCGFASGRGEAEDYTFNVVQIPACDGTPVAGTIAGINSICISGSTTLTVSGYAINATGLSFQWYNSQGPIASATGFSYTTPVLTSSESYYFRTTCANSGLFSDTPVYNVTVNNPQVVSTTPAARCGTGTVTLNATASAGANLTWYAAATGGTALATGTSFTTPSIAANTTYYVEANIGGASATAGPANYLYGGTVSTLASPSTSYYMIMSASAPTRIANVTVFASAAGTLNLQLANSAGTVMQTASYTITAAQANSTTTVLGTPIVVPVNFDIPVGTGYRLGIASGTTATLLRNTSLASPYYNVVANNLTFTGNWFADNNYWYFFYNILVSTGCSGSRVPVTATVNTAPALTLSAASATICNGQTTSAVNLTSNVGDYDSYVWTPSTGVSGTAATGFTFNPSSTTTYTLNASQTGGSQCVNSATFTVNVNALPSALTVTPSATTLCVDGPAVALTATGGLNSGISAATGTGTATNVASSTGATAYPSPYGAYYENAKQQYLIRASELTALGFTAGTSLNSIAFNVATLGTSGIHKNYTISIGNTAQSAITVFEGGLTQVFGPVDYQPVSGVNTHVFSTPFVWNGTSNIVVQVCHANDTTNAGSNFTTNAQVTYSTTSFTSSLTYRVDNIDACSSASITYTESERPNMVFGYSAQGSVVWSPVTGLYTNASATTAYTGGSASVVYAKPSATTVYTATVTNASGCSIAPAVTTVTVNQKYPFYVDADGDNYGTGSSVELCSVNATTAPAGYAVQAGDCNDAVATINPGMNEILYNGVDDNCNGVIDDNNQLLSQVAPSQCGTTLATISSLISATTFNNSTGYRFEVTNTTTGAVQVIDRPLQ